MMIFKKPVQVRFLFHERVDVDPYPGRLPVRLKRERHNLYLVLIVP